MYTALIADDHPFIRASVRFTLERAYCQVIGETDNGVDAVRLVRDREPDILVLDIGMPGLDGLEVIGRIRHMALRTRVVVLTSQSSEHFSLRCKKGGAKGFVSKLDDLSDLGKAVAAVMSGYTYFPDVGMSSVCALEDNLSEADCLALLTDREMLVLQQLARGLSNKAIGDGMLLSNKTISTYKQRLLNKLRACSLVDLADIARRHHLI